jgi:hypothetical protein
MPEGVITREAQGFIWLKHDVEGTPREDLYDLSQVEVDRDPMLHQPAILPAPAPGAPKAVVLTLGSNDSDQGDDLGIYITADALKQMVPILETELGPAHSGVVVLRVCSSGGLQSEIRPVADVIHDEYQSRWHVVAWIDKAINTTAMCVHGLEDFYFTPHASYGACTYFHGWGTARQSSFEAQLALMEQISIRGHHDPLIMRAMQIQQPLSATAEDGHVTWYADATTGAILVNRPHEILTLNAPTAEKLRFSKDTAATLAELTVRMGYKELDWLGERSSMTPWPVCKAEQWNIDNRKQVNRDEDRLSISVRDHFGAIQKAEMTVRSQRETPAGDARRCLDDIVGFAAHRPNLVFLKLGIDSAGEFKEWRAKQERFLTDMLAPLPPSLAARQTLDSVHLKDGRTFVGTITREAGGSLTIEYSLGDLHHVRTFKREDIASVSHGK